MARQPSTNSSLHVKQITLEEVLQHWPDWGLSEKPQVQTSFTAGLNHATTSILSADETLVVKLFTTPNTVAVQAQQWAAEHDLAPRIRYCDPDYRYCLMDAMNSTTLSPKQIEHSELISLAQALSRLHDADVPESEDFDLLSFCNEYLTSAGDRAANIHQSLLPALQLFVDDTTPWCFCHNDLVAANCFVVDDQAQFIDWEYAMRHNPWFDLAAIIFYLRLSDEQALLFLKHYRDDWAARLNSDIFHTAHCALLWGDMLWHLAKFGESYWPELEMKMQQVSASASALGIELASQSE